MRRVILAPLILSSCLAAGVIVAGCGGGQAKPSPAGPGNRRSATTSAPHGDVSDLLHHFVGQDSSSISRNLLGLTKRSLLAYAARHGIAYAFANPVCSPPDGANLSVWLCDDWLYDNSNGSVVLHVTVRVSVSPGGYITSVTQTG